jgi:hypothetical protein
MRQEQEMGSYSAERKILVSPFIHPRAQELAQELGIETYGDSTDVELELS